MQLISLSLKNIRSYVNQTIIFTNSMLLVGDIGSGKSTILQAVEFALFGVQRGLQDANHLLRNGEDEGEVSLTFKLDEEIIISRGLKRGKSVSQTPGKLIINGKEEHFAPTELRAKVLELLGFPESSNKAHSLIYRYTVYASQEQMKSIILEKPESRLDTLRVIFGVDKYKQIVSNAQIILREIRKEITYLDGKLENLTSLKAELAELKVSKSDVDERLAKQQSLLDSKRKIVIEKKTFVDDLKKDVDEVKQLQEKLSFIKKREVENALRQEKVRLQKNHLLREIEKLKYVQKPDNLDAQEKQLREEQELYQRNSVLQSTLQSKKESISEKISDLENQLSELHVEDSNVLLGKKEELEKRIDAFKSSLQTIELKEKELSLLEGKKESLQLSIADKKKIEEQVSSLSSCPLCKQDVPHAHKESVAKTVSDEITEKEKELENVTKSILSIQQVIHPKKEFSNKLEQLQGSFVKISNDIALHEKHSIKRKELQDKICQSKIDLETTSKKLHVISSYSFEEAKKSISELQELLSKQKHLAVLFEKKSGFEKQLVELSQDLVELEESEKKIYTDKKEAEAKIDVSIIEQFETETNDFERLQKEFQEEQLTLSSLQKDQEYATKQVTSLENQIKEKELLKKEQAFKIHFKNWLTDYFIPLQKTIETEVLSHIYQEFSALFTKWFTMLVEDENFSITLDDQFTPKIQLQGYDISIDSLSGGERTSVALAYRLALNHIVNKLIGLETRDILILDEPTEGFSTEQLDRVRDVLDVLDVPQLLIVSHEQKLDGFVDDVIRIEKGAEGSYLS